MTFKPPSRKQILQAIGNVEGLPPLLQKAFDPATDFSPLPLTKAGDWLAEHGEPGQTFDDFLISQPAGPEAGQDRIHLLPLGQFSEGRSPSLEMLRAYGAAYFMMEVKVLPPLLVAGPRFTSRINPSSGNRQILTGDVLSFLVEKLPPDAFCLIAVTMEDLYPDPSWNFVFGQASSSHRVGVFSFARYDPAFYGEKHGKDYPHILLKRSCKVLVHEIGHLFSLAHCIYFHCALNGSNHLQESDTRPMSFCPICLRKLQFVVGFDVVDRYRRLLRFYELAGFDQEARWVSARLEWIIGQAR